MVVTDNKDDLLKYSVHDLQKIYKASDVGLFAKKAFADRKLYHAKHAKEFEETILPAYSLAKEKQALELAKQRQAILKHAHTVEIAPPPIPLEQYEIAKQALEIVREQKKLHDAMLKQIAIYKSPFIAINDRTNHPKHEPPKDNNSANTGAEHQKKQELQDVNYYQKY